MSGIKRVSSQTWNDTVSWPRIWFLLQPQRSPIRGTTTIEMLWSAYQRDKGFKRHQNKWGGVVTLERRGLCWFVQNLHGKWEEHQFFALWSSDNLWTLQLLAQKMPVLQETNRGTIKNIYVIKKDTEKMLKIFSVFFWAPKSDRFFGLTQANFEANSADFHHLTQNIGNF